VVVFIVKNISILLEDFNIDKFLIKKLREEERYEKK